MFHHLGTREGAVFGDVADEQHRDTGALGIVLEFGSTLADLADTAGRRVDILGGDGLDGVDNQQVRLHSVDMLEDALRDRLADHIQFGGRRLEVGGKSVGPHLDLLLAFLTTDVEETDSLIA